MKAKRDIRYQSKAALETISRAILRYPQRAEVSMTGIQIGLRRCPGLYARVSILGSDLCINNYTYPSRALTIISVHSRLSPNIYTYLGP